MLIWERGPRFLMFQQLYSTFLIYLTD